ncbi:MAG: hypothetical protein JGK26_10730 [Microcoleus sp. PH2017_27_LUM_O_A]|uniref:hypothetical protein n=1 Tax=Microcoleus sp. PH2017_22_RUC_O_B TaxID=2798833 RepID=UPI001D48E7A8|nr:hypothetical protein [Microcoleus sp. PH2017_22_RUC_O_B]MCC3460376.1 hypothetical protein [Microcoleus sp. PH2017_11_PCY_U_A]MCC3559595.1 hypothetical protein [Microcoleus sp. PH2017_27_LUM_O_A]
MTNSQIQGFSKGGNREAIAPDCSNSVIVRSAIDCTFAQTKSVTYPLLSNSAPSVASVVKKIINPDYATGSANRAFDQQSSPIGFSRLKNQYAWVRIALARNEAIAVSILDSFISIILAICQVC